MKKMLIGIAAVMTFASCTQVAGWFGKEDSVQVNADSSSYAAYARDLSITAENAYSDLFLDSASLNQYITRNQLPDSTAGMLRNFYLVRNFQYAWFASDGPTEHARGLWSLYAGNLDSTQRDSSAVLGKSMDSLLQNDSTMIPAKDSVFAETEIRLTQKFIEYAATHPEHITREHMYYMVPAKKQDAMTLADSILNKTDSAQFTGNTMYGMLRSQLARYYQAAQQGQWDSVASIKKISKGSSAPAIASIKKKLKLTGDYTGTDTTSLFNDSLATAIRHYQLRHGLKPTGNPDDSLVASLNIPVEKRIKQILVNMNRAMWMPVQTDSARVVVNIPAQTLYVYEDSGRVMEMPVIVGKEGDGTVMFSSSINRIVFNPYWNIPESIVKEEIMPKMKADATWLRKKNLEIVNENDSIPVIRQLPGKDNPLGEVKFLFPNVHQIYLHDTPDKNLFAKNERTLSHGCIRVADASQLAAWLLNKENGWDQNKIWETMNGNQEQTVELKDPRPVSIVYLTAWVDEKGMLQFRNDIYGFDDDAASRMFI